MLTDEAQARLRGSDPELYLAFTTQQKQLRQAGAAYCPDTLPAPVSGPSPADVIRALVYGPSLNPNWI